MQRVQIVGLPRSGTKWLFLMMANNFHAEVFQIGKHDFPHERKWPTGAKFLCIHKRLDHWLNSISRTEVTLRQIRPEIYGPDLNLYEAAKLHQRFYEAWEEHGIRIEYSELLENPEETLGVIAPRLKLSRKSDKWILTGHPRERMSQAKTDYYLSIGDFKRRII